ncbi:MAG: FixH family protein [Acidobacteriota bacterium]|nr:FixH family protein [Acidobacteriota bacterium]
MKNYWKYIVISMLAGVAVFHIGAVMYIWGENYELTSPDYYEQESAYMDLVPKLKAGAVYQWQANFSRDGVSLKVTDAAGAVPALENLTLALYKPDKAGLDRTLTLTPDGSGAWRAEAGLVTGLWRYTITANLGETELAYKSSENIR